MATFSVKSLCTPAYVYFVISVVLTILAIVFGSLSYNNLCYGDICGFKDFSIMIVLHVAWIFFWTWVLNSICKGSSAISWFLVLFPFILIFLSILTGVSVGSN